MQFNRITHDDIDNIKNLQPDGWTDITDPIRFYISNECCHPIKVNIGHKLVGIGNSIVFNKTAWLSHIIVDRNYRNNGIGLDIVKNLLNDLKANAIESVSLIATELGEPVYIKAGFREVTDYVFFKREPITSDQQVSDKIVPFDGKYHSAILQMDKEISGEEREPLIKLYLDQSFAFVNGNKAEGFYLPTLGEGQILAKTDEAGIELMKMKYSKVDKAVLPSNNRNGIAFLLQNGFEQTETKCKRMIWGHEIHWQPDKYYSRIGGKLG